MSTRTTLTLDDDVAAGIAEAVRTSGRSMKVVVNDAIRAGLERAAAPRERYVLPTRRMGLRPGFDLDNIEALIEQLEGPYHR